MPAPPHTGASPPIYQIVTIRTKRPGSSFDGPQPAGSGSRALAVNCVSPGLLTSPRGICRQFTGKTGPRAGSRQRSASPSQAGTPPPIPPPALSGVAASLVPEVRLLRALRLPRGVRSRASPRQADAGQGVWLPPADVLSARTSHDRFHEVPPRLVRAAARPHGPSLSTQHIIAIEYNDDSPTCSARRGRTFALTSGDTP